MSNYEEEMYWQMNPMEALKRRCQVEAELGGCDDKSVYEAMEIESAERADEQAECDMFYAQMEDEYERNMSELVLMMQEYKDSYAANEWGDKMWSEGIDPWEEASDERPHYFLHYNPEKG